MSMLILHERRDAYLGIGHAEVKRRGEEKHVPESDITGGSRLSPMRACPYCMQVNTHETSRQELVAGYPEAAGTSRYVQAGDYNYNGLEAHQTLASGRICGLVEACLDHELCLRTAVIDTWAAEVSAQRVVLNDHGLGINVCGYKRG